MQMDDLSHKYKNIKNKCYDNKILMQYRLGEIDPVLRSQIFYHLFVEKCIICQEKFIALTSKNNISFSQGYSRSKLDKLSKTGICRPNFPQVNELKKGQIWTTISQPKNQSGESVDGIDMAVPVYILDPGTGKKSLSNIIPVVPVCDEIQYHVDGDDLILENESPLGYPILFQTWNESSMLAGNINEYRGNLNNSVIKKIEKTINYLRKSGERNISENIKSWRQKQKEKIHYLAGPVKSGLKKIKSLKKKTISLKKYKPPVSKIQNGEIFKIKYKPEKDSHICILAISKDGIPEKLFLGQVVAGESYIFPEGDGGYPTQGENTCLEIYLLTSEKPFENLDERINILLKNLNQGKDIDEL